MLYVTRWETGGFLCIIANAGAEGVSYPFLAPPRLYISNNIFRGGGGFQMEGVCLKSWKRGGGDHTYLRWWYISVPNYLFCLGGGKGN